MTILRAAFVVFGAFWGTWAVAALDVQQFLEVSSAGLGALVAATVAGSAVANLGGGALTERLGPGRALALALAAWSPSVGVLAAVGRPGWWMATFLVAVAAGGLVDVVLNITSAAVLAERPGRLLRLHAAYNGGALLGAAATGAVLAAGWSWRWSLAVVAVGAAVLAWWCGRASASIPAGLLLVAGTVRLRDAVGELRRSRLLPLAAVFALGALVEGGIGTFGVLYLREHLDVAVLAGAGAYVVGQALATGTRVVLSGERAAGRLGGVGAARAGLALAAVGLGLEVATPWVAVAAAGLAVASIGASTYWPLLSAVASRASTRPGLAVGGVSAAGYLGFLAGPPVVGALAEGAGLRAGVLALGVAAALAAVIRPVTAGGAVPGMRESSPPQRVDTSP